MEKKITIYSLVHCPYCVRAKELMNRNQVSYTELIAENMPQNEVDELLKKSGMRTFPQIFANDELIGGFTELKALDDKVGIRNFLNMPSI